MADMIIVFNGDTLDLMKRLEQYSSQGEKQTLNFMLQNFKILTTQNNGSEEITTDEMVYNSPGLIKCDQH